MAKPRDASSTRNARKGEKALFLLLPFLLAALTLLLYRPLLWIAGWLPACPFYTVFGLYCPGCGNTRSVLALLHGDVLLSLRYNLFPCACLLVLLLLYLEWGAGLFTQKRRRLLPRSARFWSPAGVLAALYWVGRNFFPLPLSFG